VNKFWR